MIRVLLHSTRASFAAFVLVPIAAMIASYLLASAARGVPLDPVVAAVHAPAINRAALSPADVPAPKPKPAPEVVAPDGAPLVAIGDAADASWWAMRKGIVGIVLLFAIHFGGAALYRRRGYIVKRWPRLDVGKAWAVLSVTVSTTATLVPLAITGDLTSAVVLAQLGGAVGLLTHSTMQQPGHAEGGEVPT